MEKCKFCQTELAEDVNFCPNCGKPTQEQETLVPAEVSAEEEKLDALDAAEAAAPEKKKASPGKIALAVGAVVLLAAILIAVIVSGLGGGETAQAPLEESVAASAQTEAAVPATTPADGNPEDVTCKGTYTVSDEEALAARETVVATIGEHSLTNGQLQVYYWSMVNSYLSSEYGYYMMMYGGLDYTQPLDTIMSAEAENQTWQQYFLGEALNYWQMSQSLALEAKKAGMDISAENQAMIDNLPASLEETAASYNMTMEELMLNNIGPGGTLEDFIAFQQLYAEGMDYYQGELAKFVPTQEDLEAFYEEHAEGYTESGITKDAKYVDVRHILVQVKGGTADENGTTTYSEEEWATCEAEAQAILDQWLAGEKNEESFAALANEKSEDPGSNTNGGLYQDVYEGQMVQPFNDWCFDENRQYGDYGLVQTSYGYHVMFYVSSEPVWLTYVESDWINQQSNDFLERLTASYPMDVDYEKIALGYINLGG